MWLKAMRVPDQSLEKGLQKCVNPLKSLPHEKFGTPVDDLTDLPI